MERASGSLGTDLRFHKGVYVVLLGLLAAFVLAGCASGPKIYTNSHPQLDVRTYKTFSFANQLGTDQGHQRSIVSSHLMTATRTQLEARGYQHRAQGGQLMVDFNLVTKEKISSRTTSGPSFGMGGYYGYRGGFYGTWDTYDTDITQYTEGTLRLDLVDASNDTLVWEGVAVGRLRDELREELEERANAVVGEMFAQFPGAGPAT